MQVIKQIGVVSLAKIMGVSGAIVGLIFSIPVGLFMMLMGVIGGAAASTESAEGAGMMAGFGIGGGLMFMIGVPVAYGVSMFIGGLIYGLVINLVFGLAGGLEVQIENRQHM